MGYTKKILYLSFFLFSAFFCSGCEVLLFPFQLIYLILAGGLALAGRLIPIAARLLPMLFFFVKVNEGTPPENVIVKNEISHQIEYIMSQNKKIDLTTCPDAAVFLSSRIVEPEKKNVASSQKMIIFAFDYGTPPDQIAAVIQSELRGKRPVSVEAHLLNGASFFNEKYRFFMTVDKLHKKGIMFRGFGTFQECTELLERPLRKASS